MNENKLGLSLYVLDSRTAKQASIHSLLAFASPLIDLVLWYRNFSIGKSSNFFSDDFLTKEFDFATNDFKHTFKPTFCTS